MLVLSRKNKQTIHIGTEEDFKNGTEVVVTIFKDKNNDDIQVGIQAEKDKKILRGELVNKYIESLDDDSA
jgi:sRNA-binding carbon storage regulator CsrA